MRSAFVAALMELAEADDRVWLLTGDLGYSVLDPFARRFADRFVNAGVAEQNMMGVAAGLARAGKVVFVYSIVNFPVMRCLEQVRNDVCYHNLDVKIVAVGGGLVYGAHGYSHHGAEDLGVMRLMPNMAVAAPGDPAEAGWATRALGRRPGPAYLRLGRGGESKVHAGAADWAIGSPIHLRGGRHLTIAGIAGGTRLALAAAERLAAVGVDAAVLSIPVLEPLDAGPLLASARQTGYLLTVEDHGRGGLGTILAERIAAGGERFRFRALYLAREPVPEAGSDEFLRRRHGLDVAAIIGQALELCGRGTA
jgi:transketolase